MELAGILVPVAVLAVALGAAGIAVHRVRSKTRELSQLAFGTDSLLEGFKKMDSVLQRTPKSVSAATSLYLPQIHRDFPEFNYADMKVRAENVIKSYLMAIDANDSSLLTEGSKELVQALELHMASLADAGTKEEYDQVKTHRTEILRYERLNGRCTVVFQTSVQYRYALVAIRDIQNGEGKSFAAGSVVAGGKDRMTQARYNVELVYVQDRDKVEDERDRGEGLNCPNCGAPITNIGQKLCSYCGSAIVPFNIRVWSFHKVLRSG